MEEERGREGVKEGEGGGESENREQDGGSKEGREQVMHTSCFKNELCMLALHVSTAC